MSTVDISLLQETAIKRQKDFKLLPYVVLRHTLGLHGINLMPGVQHKDVITDFQRKAGIMQPYVVGGDITYSQVGKAQEMTLLVEKAFASVKDNINNYKTIAVGPGELLGKNKTKQHPWNLLMIQSIIRTFGEDVLDCTFSGERDEADKSPQGAFDGYDTLIDAFITNSKITAGIGNLKSTGDIEAVADETDVDPFNQLLAFWRAAHPQLKAKPSILLVPSHVGDAYDDAFFNKFRNKPSEDAYGRTYIQGTNKKCLMVRSDIMGTGQRMILTAPGNLDFGMDSLGDEDFVQVRNPYEDPNEVQFWLQASYGTRIRSIHPKLFQINDGTPVANALSGDYVS